VLLAPLLLVLALAVTYGYPLARKDPPSYGWNWPTIVAAIGVIGMLVHAVRRRGRADTPRDPHPASRSARTETAAVGLAVLALAICMLPSGIVSLRRGAWQSRELVASVRADDLGCYAGIQRQLRHLPAGDVVLADPVTAYGVQALAPVRIVSDFKTWNGRTDSKDIERRIGLLNDAFGSADPLAAATAFDALVREFDASYVVTAAGTVTPPLGSELDDFDAAGLRSALAGHLDDAQRVAHGPGHDVGNPADEERAACDLTLWHVSRAATNA
jgi:hypothetical protein